MRSCSASCCAMASDVAVEDTAHVLARHGRMLAVYAINQHQLPRETSVTIHCAGGTVRAELPENRLLWMTESGGKWSEQLFDPQAGTFLADRFVRGTCPKCGTPDQPGDNCSKCGHHYTPTELIDPRSTLSGSR